MTAGVLSVEAAGLILGIKQTGNVDLHGATVAVHAILAGGAGDSGDGADDVSHRVDGLEFVLGKGSKVLHGLDVIGHLLHIAHTRQHHEDVVEGGGVADGITGGRVPAQALDDIQSYLGKIDQTAAADRLHDDNGLAVLDADLVAETGLDVSVFKVQIVELELNYLDGGLLGEDGLQHVGGVVEGDTHVADLALCLQLRSDFKGAVTGIVAVIPLIERVEEEEVEVVDTAGLQHGLEVRTDIRLGLEEVGGELVGEDIAVAGVA